MSKSVHESVSNPERLAVLEQTGLLTTTSEAALDRFTRLAAQLLDVGVALVSLVDADQEFIKSSAGPMKPSASERTLPLSHSFCKYVVASDEPLVIEDARTDDRVKGNPAIKELNVIAYAGFPLRSAKGHTLGSFCAVDDVPRSWTEKELDILESLSEAIMARIQLREAKEKAEIARQEAEDANAAKSRFVANMSHELRTPLNSVIGYSEMFMKDPYRWEEDRLKDGLRRVYNSGNQLLELINDVLSLSKTEAGHLSLSLDTFAVASLIEDVTEEIRPAMQENGNDFEVHGLDTVGEVYTDEAKMHQVLSNLLSNAAKYTEAGTVTLAVSTREAEDRETPGEREEVEDAAIDGQHRTLVFEISDTGIGMTEEEQQRLFEPFERAEDAKNVSGTGLGLGITKNLAEMLGGSVEVKSEKGVGSTFTVRLPIKAPPQQCSAAEQEDTRAPAGEEALRSSEAARSSTDTPLAHGGDLVLVIDDDRDARILLRRYLSEAGFQVETASTGPEGLEQAHELHPMAVTIDVFMEKMNGWEVLIRLKKDPNLRNIPAFMVTIDDDSNRGYRLGASEYLVKPIERDHLTDLLDKYRTDERPFSVLVIDDDEADRDTAQRIIEDSEGDHRIYQAENGREALRMLDEGLSPGLVLLDLMMPEMDGFEFLEATREQDYLQSVPVIVLTAKDLTDEDIRCLNGQVERIIQKEAYTHEDLLRAVQQRVETLRERSSPAEA